MSAQERECREVVTARSRGRCEICYLAGKPLEKAHRVGRGVGGGWVASNILDLCHTCHRWNHHHPQQAYANGWHLRSDQDPTIEPVRLGTALTLTPERFDPEHQWDPESAMLTSALLDDDGNIQWLETVT